MGIDYKLVYSIKISMKKYGDELTVDIGRYFSETGGIGIVCGSHFSYIEAGVL